ncbi:pentapeptide repeat-containing protein [Streptomyces scabiei]|uniref:pentapeptide repeat-containing protein n=1 Tax=Streptomyces TaxID=1883 RepID=UPI00299FA6EB|nr:pentapeptide repeat-containing protein [Streptomyces scabiei]MDX3117980.1 pentapeptide repeat-containing protein [Streptomyces scabiei]
MPAEKSMPSGVPAHWRPATMPADSRAAARLQEWVEGGGDGGLDVVGLDLSGADLSGGAFQESCFTDAELVGTKLIGADLYRADAQRADFSGADLTQASLVRADFDDAVFRGAVLDGADLVKASLYGVDASAASLRGARLAGASLIDVDLRGSDLSGAIVRENTFKVTVDETTRFTGMSGTLFGPVQLIDREGRREIGGAELERWLRQRGGRVEVLSVMAHHLMVRDSDAPARLSPILAEAFRVTREQTDVSATSERENRNWDAVVTCEYEPLQGDLSWSLDIYATGEVQHRPTEDELASFVARRLKTPVFFPWHPGFHWIRRVARPEGGLTLARVWQPEDDSPAYLVDAAESAVPGFPHISVTRFSEALHVYGPDSQRRADWPPDTGFPVTAFKGAGTRRIAVEDPEVDMDYAHRLLYRGELFTGEVTEHLGYKLVSLDVYVDGVQNGPSWEWYADGTLRSEGTVRMSLARGEFKGWHPNGTLASRRVFDDDGLTILEDDEWDEAGGPTKRWRADRTS